MTLRASTREIQMPWYAAPVHVETRGAVWQQEHAAWAGSDSAAGEITHHASDEPSAPADWPIQSADPLDTPTLRLR